MGVMDDPLDDDDDVSYAVENRNNNNNTRSITAGAVAVPRSSDCLLRFRASKE